MVRDRILLAAAILLLWGVLTHSGLVSPLFLPTPWDALRALLRGIADGSVLADVTSTLFRVVVGFLLGTVLGVVVGALLGSWRRMNRAIEPFVDFLRSVPVTALLPLFLLFFGLGSTAKIAAIAWASGLVMLINTILGVASVPPTRLMLAKTLRVRPVQRLFRVVLPDALPQIFIGLRTAISFAVVVGVVSEMLLSTDAGLGAMIYNASMMYRTETVYVGIFLAGGLGYMLNLATAALDKYVVHWRAR